MARRAWDGSGEPEAHAEPDEKQTPIRSMAITMDSPLKPGIVMCREKQDSTSAVLLEGIMADEEKHIDYLETQLQLMDMLGEPLYLAQCVSRPPK